VLQPQLAHATRSVARSSPLAQANKKEPFQDSFLLAGDEARVLFARVERQFRVLLS
jgi:hypothetical protein